MSAQPTTTTHLCPHDGRTNIIKIPVGVDEELYSIDPTTTIPYDFQACPIKDTDVKKNEFFMTLDVWSFDNIGVSKPTNVEQSIKLKSRSTNTFLEYNINRILVCGSCDLGPLGFAGHVIENGNEIGELHYFVYI